MSSKIVDFYKWCPKCEHWEESESDDPCHECLEEVVNEDSTKPVRWKEKNDA